MIYLRLFFEFFKTGLFAIGGGLATIPFLTEIGQKTGWYTMAELTNMIAVSESTPGPMGINMATYVGYTVGGPLGALVATIGEVTPCVIIILLISSMIYRYKDSFYVSNALSGIRACSLGLIAYAFLSVFTSSVIYLDRYRETGDIASAFDIRTIGIFLFILVISRFYKKSHPVIWIALSAVLGMVIFSI
ncbi:MAG: chromate transporter [Erysipelotrichaceae bacterium]|nr:chromate transporter [Erysipelotrichaceae bacterium]